MEEWSKRWKKRDLDRTVDEVGENERAVVEVVRTNRQPWHYTARIIPPKRGTQHVCNGVPKGAETPAVLPLVPLC